MLKYYKCSEPKLWSSNIFTIKSFVLKKLRNFIQLELQRDSEVTLVASELVFYKKVHELEQEWIESERLK